MVDFLSMKWAKIEAKLHFYHKKVAAITAHILSLFTSTSIPLHIIIYTRARGRCPL